MMSAMIRHNKLFKAAGSFAFLLVAFVSAKFCPAAESSPARPNVLFILADDLGWRDTTPYGSRYHRTPCIERLSQRGMMFMNAYAANPLCSPTRASIMTGLYPGRIGLTSATGHVPEVRLRAKLAERSRPDRKVVEPQPATRLDRSYATLAEILKAAGYATGHFGKWHLGAEPYSPLEQGFDVDVPHYHGPGPAGSYVAPWKYPPALKFTGEPGEHIEDRMAREAIAFMKANQDRPFYLNYWAFSVHSPWDAKSEYIPPYEFRADASLAQRNPLYAAMVQSLDEAVGTLLAAVDELGMAERTLVVFFSDNGGVHWLDDRMRQQFRMNCPPTSNAPLRGGKATLYEGGTREPCIVVWPGRVKPGSRSDALLSSVDFTPTLLEMLDVKPAETKRFDGVSQVPALLGKDAPRQEVYCYFPHYTPATGNVPGAWVRKGDDKLIRFFCDNADQSDRFELYDLAKDPGETKNLAADMPGRVKELNELLDEHLKEIGAVLPKLNPNYEGA